MAKKRDSIEKLSLGNPGNILGGKNVAKVSPKSNSNPGPRSEAAVKMAPSGELPPSTDRGDMPNFWYPFARARKRLLTGGWARQVTVKDLPIAKEMAGVNMRLTAGSIRELHWHETGEWAIMLYGSARITLMNPMGETFVDDVEEGDLWFFPKGFPHSIQGSGKDGCEFLLIFDDGNFSEDETFLLTDWLAHLPPEILTKNFGVSTEKLSTLPFEEKYIFEGSLTASLEEDRKSVGSPVKKGISPFVYRLGKAKPDISNKGGEARIVDSEKFKVSDKIAAALVTLKKGALRELHWHPNDEWLYFVRGKGTLSLFGSSGLARTMDFEAGDVAYIPATFGHYIQNKGDGDLCFLESFRSDKFVSFSLNDWMTHIPPELLEAHTGFSPDLVKKFPQSQVAIIP